MLTLLALQSQCDQATYYGETGCLESAKWASERCAVWKECEISLDLGGGRDGPNLCALLVSTSTYTVRTEVSCACTSLSHASQRILSVRGTSGREMLEPLQSCNCDDHFQFL